jgi:mono/diheme cytochrome c family protein
MKNWLEVRILSTRTSIKIVAVSAAYVAGAGIAMAASPQRAAVLPAYQQECVACHVAYPPGMLPAASWKRVMGSLNKHYGTDASLDEASVREISTWLQTNAGTGRRAAEEPPQDRITRSQWFVRQHHEVDPQIWNQVAVKSAANCAACHSGADKGSFRESEIRFPKGLDARFRRAWSD